MADLPLALILAALGKEYAAVRNQAGTHFDEMVHPAGTVYEVGLYPKASPNWRIALVETGRGGQKAADEAHRGIAFLQPSVLLMVGIAGGIKDVNLGDVVAATKVYDYEAGKVADSAGGSVFLSRPELGESSHRLVQRARAVARNHEWFTASTSGNEKSPTAYVEPMATGRKVVASRDHEIYRTLKNVYGDAIALDMESYDVLRVAYSSGVDCLAVRGVSDMLVGKAEEDALQGQERAAARAAAFALCLLRDMDPTPYKRRHGTIDELGTEVIASGEANPLLAELGGALDSYSYRGHLGRYPRSAIVGQMVENAIRAGTGHRLAVRLVLLDPANEGVLKLYADHQKSQGIAGDDGGPIHVERIRDEILATIVRMYAWKGAYPALDVDIRLTSHFSLIRVDLCPSFALITKDNPNEPMIALRSGSAFYKSFKDEVDLSASQSRTIAAGVSGIDSLQVDSNGIIALLQSLGVGVQPDPEAAARILDLVRDDTPPYSRPRVGKGLNEIHSLRKR